LSHSQTRKDKTLEAILKTLDTLHQKVDQLGLDLSRPVEMPTTEAVMPPPAFSRRRFRTKTPDTSQPHSHGDTSLASFDVPGSEVLRIMSWPAVEQLLRSDLDEIYRWEKDYNSTEDWLAEITDAFGRPLTVESRVDIITDGTAYFQAPDSRILHLHDGEIDELLGAYFSSFYYIYPVVDEDQFREKDLPQVKSSSFAETDERSPLVLLVLALGSVAQQGTIGDAIFEPPPSGRATGVKGGTVQAPPGITFLQEALRRMGLQLPKFSIPLLQCYLLAA
jgi:hypothetical protein